MLTQELISNIFKSKKDVDSEYIYEKLQEVEDITKAIKSLNKEREIEKTKYNQKLKEIELKIKELQGKCSHWTTTYYPDPSGNSDSYYLCSICGKEI